MKLLSVFLSLAVVGVAIFVSIFALSTQGKPDPEQRTLKGCICKSDCSYSLDGGSYDWCYTQNNCGSHSLTRFAYWDYCVYPENRTYEKPSAQVKHQALWDHITKNTTGGTFPSSFVGVITSLSVKTSMEAMSDVMPANRIKFVHSIGTVGQVIWKPVAGNPYSGVFASGSRHAFIRFSIAKAIKKDNLAPGLAIKFLRDGVHSGNFFAMPFLNGQSDFNFFAHNFTNHPPKPSGLASKLTFKKFSEATNCPMAVGVSDVARYDESGKEAAVVNFPYKITFVPTGLVTFPSAYYDEAQLGQLLTSIPVDTHLFNVIAYADPAAEKADKSTLIGQVYSKTSFTRSTFGDNHLFFRHQYMENDFKLRPEWLKAIDKTNQCGFDSVGLEPPHPMPAH